MNRHLLIPLFVCALLTTALFARQGVVTLTDGQKIEGDITRDEPAQVTISVRGIETSVPRDRIDSVVYFDNLQQELERRRKELDEQDAAGRITLARWAFDNRLYPEARDLLDEARQIDPNNREAAELSTLVRRQIELERRVANRPPPEQPPGDTVQGGTPAGGRPTPSDENLLNAQQVMAIKISEASPREPNLRLNVPADVRRNIVRAGNLNARRFEDASALDKLQLIRQHGTDEDLGRVTLQGDPQVLADFRHRVQPIVLAGCASAGCHNTPEAGNFMLFERATDERSTYTNFFILQQYVRKVETPGGGGGPFAGEQTQIRMIDRMRPQDSLLIHYMLPPAQAQYPHPQVQGYRPVARDRNDPRVRDVLRWIASLNSVVPNYQIDYTPPQKAPDEAQPEAAPAPAGQ